MASTLEKAAGPASFLLASDLAYTVCGFSLSAPQTTERRVKGSETEGGAPETKAEAMKWVWISSAKIIAYIGLPALLARSAWMALGGIVVLLDLHASYRYAIRCGMAANTPAGRMMASRLGVNVNGDQGSPAEGAGHEPPSSVGRPQSKVRSGAFGW
jgi:hypothetical protein